MKGAFAVGIAAGLIAGMASYAMVEPCLPAKAKKMVRRGRRAVMRAAENIM